MTTGQIARYKAGQIKSSQQTLYLVLVFALKFEYNARLRFTAACGGLTRTGSKTSRI